MWVDLNLLDVINETDRDIKSFVNSINIDEISCHNAGYKHYETDKFKFFVEAEKKRFINILHSIVMSYPNGCKVCDLGCFIPWVPLALNKLGFDVKIVDKYELYGPITKRVLSSFSREHGIKLFDIDILNDGLSILDQNDVVLLTAVVEHLCGSPKVLLNKVKEILKDEGLLLFEVPNIAEFTKRLRMLLGFSPLASYNDYFDSDYPFFGHNREMTVEEVQFLLTKTGYRIEFIECYDYSLGGGNMKIKDKIASILKKISPIKNKGELIIAKARPKRL